MYSVTTIRTLIWLAAIGTALNCTACGLSGHDRHTSDGSSGRQSVGTGYASEVVLGTGRVEKSSRRAADDDRRSGERSLVAISSTVATSANRCGRSNRSLVHGRPVSLDVAASFMCAQLQV